MRNRKNAPLLIEDSVVKVWLCGREKYATVLGQVDESMGLSLADRRIALREGTTRVSVVKATPHHHQKGQVPRVQEGLVYELKLR